MKKYELAMGIEMETNVAGKKLYRIIAIRDFGKVKAGAIGGYVESEACLSHEDDCWIADDAMVYGGARVEGNVQVLDEAIVSGDVVLEDNVRVDGDAKIQNRTETCITIGGNIHIASGALIENADNFASITTHQGTISLFRNDENGIDICFYDNDDKLVHQSVSEFLVENTEAGNLSYVEIILFGALSEIEQTVKAKAAALSR